MTVQRLEQCNCRPRNGGNQQELDEARQNSFLQPSEGCGLANTSTLTSNDLQKSTFLLF